MRRLKVTISFNPSPKEVVVIESEATNAKMAAEDALAAKSKILADEKSAPTNK